MAITTTIERDLTREQGVSVIRLIPRERFLIVTIMMAERTDTSWYGETGHTTAKYCREFANRIHTWLRYPPVYDDASVIPFEEDLFVYRYGFVYRANEVSDIEIDTNNDRDGITIRIETEQDASFLRRTLLEMANALEGNNSWR
ncbi:MAG: hypothetical protein WCK01_02455 [Candidatus Uhrbacteria bacterium]